MQNNQQWGKSGCLKLVMGGRDREARRRYLGVKMAKGQKNAF